MTVDFIGPIQSPDHYDVVVDGYIVPHLKLRGSGVSWSILLDGRLAYEVECDKPQLQTILALAANALAIGHGWSSFGANKRRMSEWDRKPMVIGEVITEDNGKP
jgi:hypothetical protein